MTDAENAESLRDAVIANRLVRAHGPYRVEIGDQALSFREFILEDPVPTGRQIVEAVGARPAVEHSVFQVLRGGQIENLRLDETTDLRSSGVERFLVFHSDRSFRLEIDGIVFEWGTRTISGRVLKTLARVDLATYGVWQEVRGEDDLAIADTGFADLSTTGVERFFTGIARTTEG